MKNLSIAPLRMRVVILMLGAIGAMASGSLVLASTTHASHPTGVISVAGQAERQLAPDLAEITIAVEQRGMALEPLRRQVNDSVSKILKALQGLRIAPADIQSGGITIRPEFTFERTGARRFEGYVVNREIQIRLRQIADLGAVIERSLDAGANQISEPIFDHSDRANVERVILSEATQAARRNAIAAAEGVEMRVGKPLKIEVQNSSATPRVAAVRMAAMDMSAAEASYQPGTLTFRVSVNAEFELITPTP